jgi:hypothetical protein
MNTTVAIVLAVGAVGAAVLILRRKAEDEGVSLCTKLGAIDGRAAAACSILGALGIDAEAVREAPAKFVGGTKGAVTGIAGTVGDAFGIGSDSGPFICGVYRASGKPRSEWPADIRSKCP